MSFDLSFLSSEPLVYFLAHSTLFVVAIAATFFTLGLAFGWFTWARFKSQRLDVLAESESLKGEIATLKRKLAEQIARASSLAEASPPADARPSHAEPDPVINSFLSTAATILHQADSPAEKPRHPLQPSAEPARESLLPDESVKPRKAVITSQVTPKNKVRQTVIHKDTGHDLTDHAGGDLAFPDLPASVVDLSEELGPRKKTPEEESAPPSGLGDPDGGSRLMSDPHMGLIYVTRPGLSDDLSHLKGVANVIERRLNDCGVYTFKQIALWSEENIREFSNLLAFKDRIHREQWVEQARELHFQKYGERL